MKGIDIGFKCIPKIFVVKKPEMEIGLPTDVKHVTHIGSENTPSWMKEFKTASDFSAMSLGNRGEPRDHDCEAISSWTSQEFEQSMGRQPDSELFKETPPTDLPNALKKHRRKKIKSSTSSPKLSPSSSRSSRVAKSKGSYVATVAEVNIMPTQQGCLP